MTVQTTAAPEKPDTGLDRLAATVDQAAILRELRLDGRDPKAQAVVLVCHRYELDPFLKHVVLVEGNVYVTRDGLLHIAHRSGQFDGLEVDEAVLTEDGKEWRSRASVHRKDMGRPFSFSGRFPAGRKNSPEMAEKVAVARALRHAFDVSIPTADERHLTEAVAHREPVDLGKALAARRAEEAPSPAVDDVTAPVVDGELDEPEVTP